MSCIIHSLSMKSKRAFRIPMRRYQFPNLAWRWKSSRPTYPKIIEYQHLRIEDCWKLSRKPDHKLTNSKPYIRSTSTKAR